MFSTVANDFRLAISHFHGERNAYYKSDLAGLIKAERKAPASLIGEMIF